GLGSLRDARRQFLIGLAGRRVLEGRRVRHRTRLRMLGRRLGQRNGRSAGQRDGRGNARYRMYAFHENLLARESLVRTESHRFGWPSHFTPRTPSGQGVRASAFSRPEQASQRRLSLELKKRKKQECAAGIARRSRLFGKTTQHSTTFTANSPRDVSLYLSFMSRPVSRMVLMTLSSDTRCLPSLRIAIRCALMALTEPIALRSMQGICTSPPIGSQVSPRLCSMPISAAFSTWRTLPPSAAVRAPAAIEHATPTSPWQPTSAPLIEAFSL